MLASFLKLDFLKKKYKEKHSGKITISKKGIFFHIKKKFNRNQSFILCYVTCVSREIKVYMVYIFDVAFFYIFKIYDF